MYKISEIAAKTQLSVPTLRYYEEIGILQPSRDEKNYRQYSEQDLNWLAFILRLKKTGMGMKEIQRYSQLRKLGDESILERMLLLEKQADKLQEELAEIQNHLIFIEEKQQIYRKMLEKNE